MSLYKRVKRKAKRILEDRGIIKVKKKRPVSVSSKQKNRDEQKGYCIEAAMDKMGWTKEYALEQIQRTMERIKITYSDYNRYDFCKMTPEEQDAKYAEILDIRQRREVIRERRQQRYITQVCEKTGWSRKEALAKMLEAEDTTGMSFEHYNHYRFWEVDESVRKDFFTKAQADMLKKRFNRNPRVMMDFINKGEFFRKYHEFMGRSILTTSDMDYETFHKQLGKEYKLIYKPLASSGGKGIQVFEYEPGHSKEMFETLKALPEGVVENYITQHPKMARLSLNSVNTVRFVTIRTREKIPGIERNKVYLVYASVRMGSGENVTDNMHSGGMVAGVDLKTGKIVTDAIDFKLNVCREHPDTGELINGFEIPYFEEAKKLVEDIASTEYGYFGWDVAITTKGPIIIEANTHPGAEILQTPYLPQRKGMRFVADKFLKGQPDVEPETPYGTKISKISRDGIEFYWKKPEHANGYAVFRGYEPNGPYEEIARIPKRSIGDYTDSEFDHSKEKVYYQVASYVTKWDGTKEFGDRTEPTEAEPIRELKTDLEAAYMYSGASRQFHAYYWWGEKDDITWSVDDPEIAVVDETGMVTAIKRGECTLTLESESLGQKATCRIVVDRQSPEPLSEITSRYEYNEETGFYQQKPEAKHEPKPAPVPVDGEDTEAGPEQPEALIMMVGDMMCGKKQTTKQWVEGEGWNFNPTFEYVRKVTAESDLAVGNLETLLAPGWPYMEDETYINNKNNCNAPSRYLDAVRYGGFDLMVMANNHNCDGGVRALMETIDEVDRYDFIRTGVFKDDSEKRFVICDVNGIKVGFLAYMSMRTGFNGKDQNWTTEEKAVHLNVFTEYKAKQDIEAIRKAGAEFVIVYMHWGFKNFRVPTDSQVFEAREVANAGADYIVGSNPHLLQRMRRLKMADGRRVPCAYSIGNFQAVMNQVVGNRDSIMLRLILSRDEEGKVYIKRNNYIPFHTYRKFGGCRWAPVALSMKYEIGRKRRNRKVIRERIIEIVGRSVKPY